MKRASLWAWLWMALALLYFFVPLYGTLDFSLRAKKDTVSLLAYERVFKDSQFLGTTTKLTPEAWERLSGAAGAVRAALGPVGFSVSPENFVMTFRWFDVAYRFAPGAFVFSSIMGLLTILVSLTLVVPTAYWIHLRLPRLRPIVELITLLPFVIPTIILVFGLLRTYGRPPLLLTATGARTNLLLVAGYVVLSLPYMYRAVDTGLRAIDVRTLTEAAQSLGAGWPTIILRVIFPNLRVAILSGSLLTFALVIGEFILASFLARPAFGPYLVLVGQSKAYEPAALTIISFSLTWFMLGMITVVSSGRLGRMVAAAGRGQFTA